MATCGIIDKLNKKLNKFPLKGFSYILRKQIMQHKFIFVDIFCGKSFKSERGNVKPEGNKTVNYCTKNANDKLIK